MKSRRRRGGPGARSTWHLDPGAPARILWRRVLCSTPITPKTSDPGKFTDPELFSRSHKQRKDPWRRKPRTREGGDAGASKDMVRKHSQGAICDCKVCKTMPGREMSDYKEQDRSGRRCLKVMFTWTPPGTRSRSHMGPKQRGRSPPTYRPTE